MGIIVPTGIATDATTQAFFRDILPNLVALYDFRNKGFFEDVASAQGVRFCALVVNGQPVSQHARIVFRATAIEDVHREDRIVRLASDDIALVNPNTGTCPVFLSRTDAEITLGIYRRHPVVIRDGDERGNPWALRFVRMFDMANDSGLFHTADDLSAEGAEFDGWAWTKGPKRWLPLHEAKMLNFYNHRHGDYRLAVRTPGKEVRALPNPSVEQLDDPQFETVARYWVAESNISQAIGDRWDREWLLGWRDIATSLDVRTFVPSVLPHAAVGHVFPLALPVHPDHAPLLQAVWSSLACDYVVRQKLSGTHLTYSVLGQIACPAPETFERPQPWSGRVPLREWVLPRVLELSYTSWRIRPYAVDLGDDGPPFRWLPERRELLAGLSWLCRGWGCLPMSAGLFRRLRCIT
jgi:hypothetical protein